VFLGPHFLNPRQDVDPFSRVFTAKPRDSQTDRSQQSRAFDAAENASISIFVSRIRIDIKTLFQDLQTLNTRVFQDSKNSFSGTFQHTPHSQKHGCMRSKTAHTKSVFDVTANANAIAVVVLM